MSGSSVGPPASVSLRTAAASHPSAPIPVQGPALGEGVRVALGESGIDVFPLALGGAEFGWNVDVEASRGILDTYAPLGGDMLHPAHRFYGGRSEHSTRTQHDKRLVR